MTYGESGNGGSTHQDVLMNFNLLFKLNDAGLRDRITPLIRISYGY